MKDRLFWWRLRVRASVVLGLRTWIFGNADMDELRNPFDVSLIDED